MPCINVVRVKRETADWRSFGDGNKELERCRRSWKGYEESCEPHLQDVELLIQWDTYGDKSPGEKLEEAICLHMHLANQRDHLDSLACEARDLVVIALVHYHAVDQDPSEENLGREISQRRSTRGGTTQLGGS